MGKWSKPYPLNVVATAKDHTAATRRQAGETYAAIARDFGVSTQRIRERIANHGKKIRIGRCPDCHMESKPLEV